MIQTITVGSCVQVQGLFVKSLPNGRVMVSVGDDKYVGLPISGHVNTELKSA